MHQVLQKVLATSRKTRSHGPRFQWNIRKQWEKPMVEKIESTENQDSHFRKFKRLRDLYPINLIEFFHKDWNISRKQAGINCVFPVNFKETLTDQSNCSDEFSGVTWDQKKRGTKWEERRRGRKGEERWFSYGKSVTFWKLTWKSVRQQRK